MQTNDISFFLNIQKPYEWISEGMLKDTVQFISLMHIYLLLFNFEFHVF